MLLSIPPPLVRGQVRLSIALQRELLLSVVLLESRAADESIAAAACSSSAARIIFAPRPVRLPRETGDLNDLEGRKELLYRIRQAVP